ncbi:unnamed protein product [Coregonus sp. 'balchen']|nr:unnamed protein product [Coregonus sp. 'balchen']
MVLVEECGGVCEPSQGVAPGRQGERRRPSPQGVLLSLGLVMMVGGRLDRIRREMSEDSVRVPPSLHLPLPPTPPPWDLEAPPSYDSVMKSRGPSDL